MAEDRAVAADAESGSKDSTTCAEQGDDMGEDKTGAPAPALPLEENSCGQKNTCKDSKQEHADVEESNNSVLQENTLHGHPLTISQCKFQAHIARVYTIAEAQAVSKAVSAQAKHDAGFAGFVCPFAYRLACVERQNSRGDDDSSQAAMSYSYNGMGAETTNKEEGFCDNGDVGSGEKLLYLLQKWDVRHRVLVVTRIDGGFMRAELLGIRRYKFVIDRAKRLLENSDLALLREAVNADINPPTTTAENHSSLIARHNAALGGCRNRPPEGRRSRDNRVTAEDNLQDRFAVPHPARKRLPNNSGDNFLSGAPPVNGGPTTSPRKVNDDEEGMDGATQLSKKNSKSGADRGVGGVGNTRERRTLSLAQLSISSETIAFPPGHVPCFMGTKGHGKKRGRINHFAVPTPPSTSNGDNNNGGAAEDGRRVDPNDNPDTGPSDERHRNGWTSPWSLPHELDPTSATTSPGRDGGDGGGGGGGGGGAAGRKSSGRGCDTSRLTMEPSFENSATGPLVSRTSSYTTINPPGRIPAIMLGVFAGISNDHAIDPPPPVATATVGGQCHRKNSTAPPPCSINPDGAGRTPDNGSVGRFSGENTSDGSLYIRGSLNSHQQQASPTTKDVSGCLAGGTWAGGALHRPVLGGGRDSINNTNCGLRLPLLRGTPGVGVREEQPPGTAGSAGTVESNASIGGWKEDDERSISTAGGDNDDDTGEPTQSQVPGYSRVGRAAVVARTGRQQQQHKQKPQQRDSHGVWCPGDPTPRERLVSRDSDPMHPRSSNSGLRGWSVGRAVSASQPLVTESNTQFH